MVYTLTNCAVIVQQVETAHFGAMRVEHIDLHELMYGKWSCNIIQFAKSQWVIC